MAKDDFDWQVYQATENFIQGKLGLLIKNNTAIDKFRSALEKMTSTRLQDWVDHLVLPQNDGLVDTLKDVGYTEQHEAELEEGIALYTHPGSIFFPILIGDSHDMVLALKVENVEAFKSKNDLKNEITGMQNSQYRRLDINKENDVEFITVERRGYDGFLVDDPPDIEPYVGAYNALSKRERNFDNDTDGFSELKSVLNGLSTQISKDRLADDFFRAERYFWEERNTAARLQRSRHDKFGLGWGNHDHVAYRSSREHFTELVGIFEMLGFEPRERFYAGKQAGWGAQVMEQPVDKIAIFADVDLDAEERDEDFAHNGLSPRNEMGTIGLWVGLHGESILQAGLHHLAIRCDFSGMNATLPASGVPIMAPFSSFPFLLQAFTEGERWTPIIDRVKNLYKAGSISNIQESQFLEKSAIGGHVEIIERNQGFKGFNQDSVSAIITATDPRTQPEKGA